MPSTIAKRPRTELGGAMVQKQRNISVANEQVPQSSHAPALEQPHNIECRTEPVATKPADKPTEEVTVICLH